MARYDHLCKYLLRPQPSDTLALTLQYAHKSRRCGAYVIRYFICGAACRMLHNLFFGIEKAMSPVQCRAVFPRQRQCHVHFSWEAAPRAPVIVEGDEKR